MLLTRPLQRVRTALALLGFTAALSECALQPSGVEEGAEAPTGLSEGVTLYFLDDDQQLTPQKRDTGRLGTIPDAVSLLLTGPGVSPLNTGIELARVTRADAVVSGGLIELHLPLGSAEVTDQGIDQIVCTAAAAHIQGGGDQPVRVRLQLTDGPAVPGEAAPAETGPERGDARATAAPSLRPSVRPTAQQCPVLP